MPTGRQFTTHVALLLALLLAMPAAATARNPLGPTPDCAAAPVPHLRSGNADVRLVSARCSGTGQSCEVEAAYVFANPEQGPQRLVAEVELGREELVKRVRLQVDGRFVRPGKRVEERLEFIDLGGYESSRVSRIHWLVMELDMTAGSRFPVEVRFESMADRLGYDAAP